jgi:hypothetical protein
MLKRFFHSMRKKLRKKYYNDGKVQKATRIKYKLHFRSNEKIRRYYNKKSVLKKMEINIPTIFCFDKDPITTSSFYNNLCNAILKSKPANLWISHENTEYIGLSASFLFDQLIKDYVRKWKRIGINVGISGCVSKLSVQVNNFLLSFGLLQELGVNASDVKNAKIDNDYKSKYVTLKRTGTKNKSYQKGESCVSLVNYFDSCFNHNGLQITSEGKEKLIDMFGEIIGNAEEHCDNSYGKWYALGCYNKEEHTCGFSIINFGKTVFENLSHRSSTANDVLDRIERVINSNKKLLIQMTELGRDHNEPIWNVMAIQDGISSKRTITGRGRTRGQGIMDVITFVDSVKAENDGASLCFVSGRSAILIDFEYPIISREVGNPPEIRRFMIFNKSGNLHNPPDTKKVIFLKDYFPGTMFSGRFRIDEKYLKNKLEINNGQKN